MVPCFSSLEWFLPYIFLFVVFVVKLCPTLFRHHGPVACQVPLSRVFSRQEHGVGSHVLLQGGLPNLGIEPTSLHWEVDSLSLNHHIFL